MVVSDCAFITISDILLLKMKLFQEEYVFMLVMTICSAPGSIIGPWTSEKLGRLPTFYYSSWGGFGVTCLLLICLGSVLIYLELLVAVTFYCILGSVLWIYTPEYYPTYIRTTAVGVIGGIR